ncbi:hypothetical protein ElyMa_005641000 [Elysia marginata]|uniref:SERTA domain-containing protein n=1 Tax=Elysia marginata TaxID=1093978 RepID=A0AAV4F8W2_9GAST|nr:hypothetical protein ElyMa_005641000 [Elysia marginata]
MTPLLNDLDYLAELTNCLTNALARLLQHRPPDPISFIERSLRQHRRLHPTQQQGRKSHRSAVSQENCPVASPDTVVHLNDRSAPDPSSSGASSTVTASLKRGLANRAQGHEEDFLVDDCFDSVSPATNMVHETFKCDFSTIGDLFDDDDFG